MTTNWQ